MTQQTTDIKLSITFETKCWENDWEYLLKTRYLNRMVMNCNVNFQFRQLIINNVNDPKKVEKYADKKVKEGIIDAYYFVDDYVDDALKYFDIDKASLGIGYYYSSAELVGLFLSKTKYLLHFASDTFLHRKSRSNWILNACDILGKRSECIVANPTWNFNFKEAENESTDKMDGFYISYGFSDQCYLVNTEIFRQKIYNYKHPESERYPKYADDLFEKRVDSFMRTKCLYRLTSMNETYIHYNFPKLRNKIFIILLIKSYIYYLLPFLGIIQKNIKVLLKRSVLKLKDNNATNS